MKNIKLISLAALTLLAFACTKEQEAVKDSVTLKSADLTVGRKGVSGSAASAATIEFSANNNWTATPDVDWITLSSTSGAAGDVKLKVNVAENDTYEERSGAVIIACGESKAKVTINQTLKEQFGVAVNRVLGYEEQTLVLAVGTNMEYNIDIDCDEAATPWIYLADTKAEPQIEGVSLLVEANMGNTERYATVTIGNDNAMVQYFLTQEGRSNATLIGVAYAGNRQKPYDVDTWTPTTFAQYSIVLEKTDTTQTTMGIVINVLKEGVDKTTLPTGTFTCDAAATHEAGTFSIKPTDESEGAYTSILIGENEVLVMDGTVEISKNENEYTINCNVMDENGNTRKFKYIGAVESVQDVCIGAQAYTEFYADYNTHFAQASNQWNVSCYMSEAIPGVNELVYALDFKLFGESGDAKYDAIPAGTYTFATPETTGTTPCGNLDAAPMTFVSESMSGYSNYDAATGDCRYADITGGTITISAVDSEDHIFNIEYSLNIKTYKYNWDTYEEEDVKTYEYNYKYEDVKYVAGDSGMRPVLDEDQKFTGCSVSNNYTSYWYGDDRFGISGTHIFWFGYQYVNSELNVNIPISTNGEWAWVADFKGKYCTTPIPDGTYEFSSTPVANCICNIGTPVSRKATITNGYTGSKAYVTGGNIVFSNNATHIDFNLTATIPGDEPKEVHYTGGFDTGINAGHLDSSSKEITWASLE